MASKRRLRRNACTGKTRHPNAATAQRHIAALTRAGKWSGHMDAYRCRFCNGFHVGHGRGQP